MNPDEIRAVQAEERTALAWTRTVLALGVEAAIALRVSFEAGEVVAGLVLAVALTGVALAAGAFATERYRSLHRGARPGDVANPRALRALTRATAAIAVLAAGLSLLAQ